MGRGRGAEPMDQRCPRSQRRSRLKKTQICISRGCYNAGRECQIERVHIEHNVLRDLAYTKYSRENE